MLIISHQTPNILIFLGLLASTEAMKLATKVTNFVDITLKLYMIMF